MFRELLIAFGIAAVCVLIHTIGIVGLAEFLLTRRSVRERRLGLPGYTMVLLIIFAVVIVLHVAETGIWAAFYYMRGLFPDYETALYFSLGSYTTIGYGDVVLPQRWRLLGAIEGISGVLLCGLSGAFLFVIVSRLFQDRLLKQGKQEFLEFKAD